MAIKLTTETGESLSVQGVDVLIADSALKAGLQLNTRCGGYGTCGGCACRLGPGEYEVRGEKVSIYKHGGMTALACQTKVLDPDAEVHFPRTSLVEKEAQIDSDFSFQQTESRTRSRKTFLKIAGEQPHGSDWDTVEALLKQKTGMARICISIDVLRKLPDGLENPHTGFTITTGEREGYWDVVDIEPGDTTDNHYGLAVDIGTTTVAALLIDLNENTVVTKASMYNQQILKADDVASRISYCRSKKQLQELQKLVVKKTLNALSKRVCEQSKIKEKQIVRCAVSGNTVMTHLFMGLSPEKIGTLPFKPVTHEYQSCLSRQVGLSINANAIVDVVPSVSGYIGGDITSDIFISQLDTLTATTLLIDIGTNGEIVLKEASALTACATAAGPAFEGHGITHGCRAATGAVEKIHFDASLDFKLKVIGDGKPTGICGSGIIDFIAEGLRCGLINQMGRYNRDMLEAKGLLLQDSSLCGNSIACILADSSQSETKGPLFISELDLSQIMKAKAAIYAGMKTLIQSRQRKFSDIQRVVLAGGFARYINIENAITIGLLPELPVERFEVIGNGSLAGAYQAMVNPEAMPRYQAIIKLPAIKELNTDKNFEPNFVDALALPNLDEEDFPLTLEALR